MAGRPIALSINVNNTSIFCLLVRAPIPTDAGILHAFKFWRHGTNLLSPCLIQIEKPTDERPRYITSIGIRFFSACWMPYKQQFHLENFETKTIWSWGEVLSCGCFTQQSPGKVYQLITDRNSRGLAVEMHDSCSQSVVRIPEKSTLVTGYLTSICSLDLTKLLSEPRTKLYDPP